MKLENARSAFSNDRLEMVQSWSDSSTDTTPAEESKLVHGLPSPGSLRPSNQFVAHARKYSTGSPERSEPHIRDKFGIAMLKIGMRRIAVDRRIGYMQRRPNRHGRSRSGHSVVHRSLNRLTTPRLAGDIDRGKASSPGSRPASHHEIEQMPP
jgi:hypothetical protein